MSSRESRVERLVLHLPNDVRHVVIASVGDGGGKVGDLQRCGVHLALPNGNRDNRQAIPRAFVVSVVVLGIGNQAAFFAWKVDAEFVAEAHRHHIVAPCVHRLLWRFVLLPIANHVVESPTEIAVARGADGGNQRQRRPMAVAADAQTFVDESAIAGVGGLGRNNAFGKERECLRGFEGRARRILSHNRAVQQRFPRIFLQFDVLFSALPTYHDARVVRG